MQHLRRFVKFDTYTMSCKISHYRKSVIFCMLLNGMSNVSKFVFWTHLFNTKI